MPPAPQGSSAEIQGSFVDKSPAVGGVAVLHGSFTEMQGSFAEIQDSFSDKRPAAGGKEGVDHETHIAGLNLEIRRLNARLLQLELVLCCSCVVECCSVFQCVAVWCGVV